MIGRLLGIGGEQRAISYQTLFASGADFQTTTPSGKVINDTTALKIGAVYAAVRLLSDTISTLPADTFVRQDGQRRPFRPKPAWVNNPDAGTTREDHVAQVMISLLLDGNAFVRVYRSESGRNAGLPTALVVLDPKKIEVKRAADGDVVYVFEDKVTLQRSEMLHITELKKPGELRGMSRIDQVKDTLGIAAALDEFSARFFGQGSTASGILELSSMLTKEQALQLKDTFEASHKGVHKSHKVGVLGGGAKFVSTQVEPEKAQMLESRRFAVEEVARAFRVPQHMLQVAAPGVQSYASNEENAIQFAVYTLRPYLAKLEAAYSSLLPGEAFIKFNMDGLLRGDLGSRYSAYSTALQSGFMSINGVRRLEDFRQVEGGDSYRVPLANVNVEAANITEQNTRVGMLARLVQMGFDPSESLEVVGLPPIEHTGLPSVQLQQPATLNPEDPEEAYPVRADVGPQEFADAVSSAIGSMQPPVVNVQVPEPQARSRKIKRDEDGNITEIVEG